MSEYEKQQPIAGGGTLLRAEDGTLYFIPHEKLEPFKLPEKTADPVEQLLFEEKEDIHIVSALPAPFARRLGLLAGDDDPTVVVANIGSIRRRF